MATRVFLLSGDEKAVHAITQILDELEISFEHSSDTPFSLKRLGAQRFDLLVVDCDNVQNATQVFNSARASALNKGAIAIAIVEGKAGVPNAFRLGASLVLTKPVSLEQVRNTLRTGIGMTRKDGPESKPVASAPQNPVPTHTTASAPTPHPVVPAIPAPVAKAPATFSIVPPTSPAPTNTSAAPAGSTIAPATVSATPAAPAHAHVTPITAAHPTSAAVTPPVETARSESPASLPSATAAPKPILKPAESPAPPSKPLSTLLVDEKVIPPAPAAPKPPIAESKPALASSQGLAKPTPLPISLPTTSSGAAAAPALSKDHSLASILKDSAPTTTLDDVKSPTEDEIDLLEPLHKSSELEDSPASLRAQAVPAFGGLSKSPFAGIETPRSGHGLLIASIVVLVLAGAFGAAWFLQPKFHDAVIWKYGQVQQEIATWRGHSAPVATNPKSVTPQTPKAVPAAAVPASSTTVPAQSAGVPGQSAATAGPADATPTNSNAASGAPSSAPTPSSAVATPAAAPAATPAPAPEKAAKTTSSATKPDISPTHSTAKSAASAAGTASLPTSVASHAPAGEIYEVPEDYADDQVIHRVHPVYPKQARGKKLQGTVVLQAIVDKQGKVNSLQLVSGDPILAQAAADAVKQWRYKPYSHNGDPADFQTRVTVDFHQP